MNEQGAVIIIISTLSLTWTVEHVPDAQNIALNKSAYQSSTDDDDVTRNAAGSAVDGNLANNWEVGDLCSHTAEDPEAWWAVDLQGTYTLDYVTLTNRNDEFGDRLADVHVGMTDVVPRNNERMRRADFDLKECNFHSGAVPNGATVRIDCPSGVATGCYLVVQLQGTNFLTLCEVTAAGATSSTSTATSSTSTTTSSTTSSTSSSTSTTTSSTTTSTTSSTSSTTTSTTTSTTPSAPTPVANSGGQVSTTGSWNIFDTNNEALPRARDDNFDTCHELQLQGVSNLLKVELIVPFKTLQARIITSGEDVIFGPNTETSKCKDAASLLMTHDSSTASSKGKTCKPFCVVPGTCVLEDTTILSTEKRRFDFPCICHHASCNELYLLFQAVDLRGQSSICEVKLSYP